jgi:hypothetical protein
MLRCARPSCAHMRCRLLQPSRMKVCVLILMPLPPFQQQGQTPLLGGLATVCWCAVPTTSSVLCCRLVQ